jgi:hypothetical protein
MGAIEKAESDVICRHEAKKEKLANNNEEEGEKKEEVKAEAAADENENEAQVQRHNKKGWEIMITIHSEDIDPARTLAVDCPINRKQYSWLLTSWPKKCVLDSEDYDSDNDTDEEDRGAYDDDLTDAMIDEMVEAGENKRKAKLQSRLAKDPTGFMFQYVYSYVAEGTPAWGSHLMPLCNDADKSTNIAMILVTDVDLK